MVIEFEIGLFVLAIYSPINNTVMLSRSLFLGKHPRQLTNTLCIIFIFAQLLFFINQRKRENGNIFILIKSTKNFMLTCLYSILLFFTALKMTIFKMKNCDIFLSA